MTIRFAFPAWNTEDNHMQIPGCTAAGYRMIGQAPLTPGGEAGRPQTASLFNSIEHPLQPRPPEPTGLMQSLPAVLTYPG